LTRQITWHCIPGDRTLEYKPSSNNFRIGQLVEIMSLLPHPFFTFFLGGGVASSCFIFDWHTKQLRKLKQAYLIQIVLSPILNLLEKYKNISSEIFVLVSPIHLQDVY
jgi:hypothetical protein